MFTSREIQELNELEMNVYNYVAANYKQIQYMTVRELAQEAHVSTSTVLHFCKKNGCNGYSEFKYELKRYLSELSKTENSYDVSEIHHFFKYADSEEFKRL